jgi:hypothetical protein
MTTLGWTLYAPIAAIVLIVLIVLAAMAYDLTPLGDWTDRLLAGSRDMGDELDEIRFDWPNRPKPIRRSPMVGETRERDAA